MLVFGYVEHSRRITSRIKCNLKRIKITGTMKVSESTLIGTATATATNLSQTDLLKAEAAQCQPTTTHPNPKAEIQFFPPTDRQASLKIRATTRFLRIQ